MLDCDRLIYVGFCAFSITVLSGGSRISSAGFVSAGLSSRSVTLLSFVHAAEDKVVRSS
jgi:hypothetical protein